METKIKKPCEYTQKEWAELSDNERVISNAQIANEIILNADKKATNLECYCYTDKSWKLCDMLDCFNYSQLRIAPNPTYRPFTIEELKKRFNCPLVDRNNGNITRIEQIDTTLENVKIGLDWKTGVELIHGYTFLNGEPFGKRVKP